MRLAAVVLVVLYLIFVHGPEGQEIQLNVNEISSIRQPRESEGHFSPEVHCLVFMTNGKFAGTTETCREVVGKIAQVEKQE
jgi:hypothetical protein